VWGLGCCCVRSLNGNGVHGGGREFNVPVFLLHHVTLSNPIPVLSTLPQQQQQPTHLDCTIPLHLHSPLPTPCLLHQPHQLNFSSRCTPSPIFYRRILFACFLDAPVLAELKTTLTDILPISPVTDNVNPEMSAVESPSSPPPPVPLVSTTNPKAAAQAAAAADAKNIVRRKLTGYVGFANLPNQWHRKSVRKGFNFNVMVVGMSRSKRRFPARALLARLFYARHVPCMVLSRLLTFVATACR